MQQAGDVKDYSVHPATPITFGGEVEDSLAPLPRLPLNTRALIRPATPPLPPVSHPLLPPPEFYRLRLLLPDEEDDEDDGGGLFALPAGMQQALAAADAASLPIGQRMDPLYPFILFLALGVGSSYINLDPLARYTILWMVLLVLGAFLTLVDSPRTSGEMSSSNLGWGASFGLVFTLPLLILMRPVLASMVSVLFGEMALPVLFQTVVLLAPLAETLFLRGALLERRGFWAALLGAAVMSIVMYWPAAFDQPVYLAATTIFMTVLAGIYGFVRTRYGLSAALVCQVCVSALLLFVPAALA